MNLTDSRPKLPSRLRSILHLLARVVATAGGIGLSTASVLSVQALPSGRSYVGGLASHFRVQYLIGLLVCGLVLVAMRRRGAAAILAPALALNAFLVFSRFVPVAADPSAVSVIAETSGGDAGEAIVEASTDNLLLRLLWFNVLGANPNHDAILRVVSDSGADLVVLGEVRPGLAERFQDVLPGYRVAAIEARDDNFGMALLVADQGVEPESAIQVHGARAFVLRTDDAKAHPAIEATLEWNGREVGLLGLHVVPPTSAANARARAADIQAAADRLRDRQRPYIVAGDLNTSFWGPDFDRLLGVGLVDGGRGFGVLATWPALLPPAFRIPLDHVLVDPALQVRSLRLGDAAGSDHRPVMAGLSWRTP